MATEASLLSAVRLELGDQLEPFRDSFRGTGDKDDYDLPARNITALTVFTVGGDDAITPLVEGVDYTVDRIDGIITFTDPPEQDTLYIDWPQRTDRLIEYEVRQMSLIYVQAS